MRTDDVPLHGVIRMDSLEEVSHTRDPKMEKTEQAKGWAIAPAGDTYGDSRKMWRPRPEGRRTLNPPPHPPPGAHSPQENRVTSKCPRKSHGTEPLTCGIRGCLQTGGVRTELNMWDTGQRWGESRSSPGGAGLEKGVPPFSRAWTVCTNALVYADTQLSFGETGTWVPARQRVPRRLAPTNTPGAGSPRGFRADATPHPCHPSSGPGT